jgi:flavodoxin
MKTAVIYYSYEGNCALIAGIIKSCMDADIFEIKTRDNKKRSGFMKYFLGVAQVFLRKRPELLPLAADINSCDLVILGTPVWAASPAPAVVSFLDKTKISGKKIALFCCHGGGMGKALEKFKALLPGNTLVGEIDFVYPARNEGPELKRKIEEWVKTIS